MALPGPFRDELSKYRRTKSSSLDGRLHQPGAASSYSAASDTFALPAGTLPREYDPIFAVYQEMKAAYEQPHSQFDDPMTPPQQAKTSEARFTGDDGIDAVVIDRLQSWREIQEAMDQVKATDELPEFAREWVEESAPELDSAEPPVDMDSLMMPAEFAVQPDEFQEPQPPLSAEGLSPLEQIVMTEMPEPMPPMPAQPEYDAALLTPMLLDQALQQASAPSQPEDPEEQLRRQENIDRLLNPYNALFYNPFGTPGPG